MDRPEFDWKRMKEIAADELCSEHDGAEYCAACLAIRGTRWALQMSSTMDHQAAEIATQAARIKELELRVEMEERHHLATIDQRDNAEESLSQAYFLIKGMSPEWSNLFGHAEAIEDIDDAQRSLRLALQQAEKRASEAFARGEESGIRAANVMQEDIYVNAVLALIPKPSEPAK
jgi:hypothetical protein